MVRTTQVVWSEIIFVEYKKSLKKDLDQTADLKYKEYTFVYLN